MNVKFGVGINKVALLRNARGRDVPNIVEAAKLLISAGCEVIKIHQWEDNRHILLRDIYSLSEIDEIKSGKVLLNVGGTIRKYLLEVVKECEVHQFTITPFKKEELTTQKGWDHNDSKNELLMLNDYFQKKTKIIIFVDAKIEDVDFAKSMNADGIEINCREYVNYFDDENKRNQILETILKVSTYAKSLELEVHLAHDLDIIKIEPLIKMIKPEQITVGHTFIAESLLEGIPLAAKKYKDIFKF